MSPLLSDLVQGTEPNFDLGGEPGDGLCLSRYGKWENGVSSFSAVSHWKNELTPFSPRGKKWTEMILL
jgi:hypothetical protein